MLTAFDFFFKFMNQNHDFRVNTTLTANTITP